MQLEILSEWCAVSGREKHWSPQISLAFTIFSAQFNCIVPAAGEVRVRENRRLKSSRSFFDMRPPW
jgi:hypothetical protein